MRIRATQLLFVGLASFVAGCPDGTKTAEECSKQLSSLSQLCPVGTVPKLSSEASGTCDGNGKYDPQAGSGELGGNCTSNGSCEVACIATAMTCPCGLLSFSRDMVTCQQCASGCGDGTCSSTENEQSCPMDCAPVQPDAGAGGALSSSSSQGGSGSTSSSAGETGGSTSDISGPDAGASTSGGGASTGTAATTGATGGSATSTGSSSTGGAMGATKCTKPKTFGRYLLRDDGFLLLVTVDSAGKATQTPVLEKSTGMPLGHVVDVADTNGVACAALDDGTVACWQTAANRNASGALGNGTTETDGVLLKAAPVLTGPGMPLDHVVDLAESSSDDEGATCAITSEGKLYCWGSLDWIVNGGKGLPSAYAQAITLDGIQEMTDVKQAAMAFGGGCALRNAGDANEVWCWGAGRYNQLPDTKDSQYPEKILGLTNPTKVAADGTTVYNYVPIHTFCAIDDGNVRCWGSDSHGEVGDGSGMSTVQSPTLVQTSSGAELSGVTDLIGGGSAGITQGNGSFCGLRQGALWCWGWFGKTATNYGATNVTMLGDPRGPTFLTSDNVLHVGSATVTPSCGKL